LLWVLTGVILSLYLGSFKSVMREAYNSKYINPINKVTLFRDGQPETLKIKMFRNPAHDKKAIGVRALKKRVLFFKRNKGGLGGV
jgi:hypothetical protein